MQNLKKIIIFFAAVGNHGEIQTIGRQAAQIAGKSIETSSQTMIDGAKETSAILANGANEASSNFAIKSVEALAPTLKNVGYTFAIVYTGAQLWNIGKDIKNAASSIKSYYYPTQEQKNKELETEKKYNYLSTEKAFKKCLLKNADSQRSSSGLPAVCDETAQMFAMFAGNKEANEITETFKQYFNEPKK